MWHGVPPFQTWLTDRVYCRCASVVQGWAVAMGSPSGPDACLGWRTRCRSCRPRCPTPTGRAWCQRAEAARRGSVHIETPQPRPLNTLYGRSCRRLVQIYPNAMPVVARSHALIASTTCGTEREVVSSRSGRSSWCHAFMAAWFACMCHSGTSQPTCARRI